MRFNLSHLYHTISVCKTCGTIEKKIRWVRGPLCRVTATCFVCHAHENLKGVIWITTSPLFPLSLSFSCAFFPKSTNAYALSLSLTVSLSLNKTKLVALSLLKQVGVSGPNLGADSVPCYRPKTSHVIGLMTFDFHCFGLWAPWDGPYITHLRASLQFHQWGRHGNLNHLGTFGKQGIFLIPK